MDNLEEDDANSQNNCRMSEYADHLRVWLNRAYQWQCMPYSMPLVQNRYSSQRFQSFANQNEINDNFVPFQQAPVQQAAAGRTIPAALPEQRPNGVYISLSSFFHATSHECGTCLNVYFSFQKLSMLSQNYLSAFWLN